MNIVATTGIALLCVSSISNHPKSTKSADLAVLEITAPDWVDDRTVFEVVIKNKGNEVSSPTMVLAYDLDISAKEAKKLDWSKTWVDAIKENNGRAEYRKDTSWGGENVDEDSLDYDWYWELQVEIPALKPGQKHKILFELKDYWIYDSNCEIIVVIDPENKSVDSDRENNSKVFIGWG